MSNLQIKNNWNAIKKKLKRDYPHLSKEELKYNEENEQKFLARIQKKIGLSNEEFIFILYNYIDETWDNNSK